MLHNHYSSASGDNDEMRLDVGFYFLFHSDVLLGVLAGLVCPGGFSFIIFHSDLKASINHRIMLQLKIAPFQPTMKSQRQIDCVTITNSYFKQS